MAVVGIDIATNTGLAVVGEGWNEGKSLTIPTAKGYHRLQLFAQQLDHILDIWTPHRVMIEGYGFGLNPSSSIVLVEYGTVVRQRLHARGLPWYEVRPSTLKKWTTGKGNAKKPDMAIAVKERWGFVSPSHDIVDAYALAQLGQLNPVDLIAIKGITYAS